MIETSFILFYVSSPEDSAPWYASLLGRPVVETSPTFAMIPLREHLMLGLWRRDGVLPPADGSAGASELAFTARDADELHILHASWIAKGIGILQPPTPMDFGLTFVARDPDGHRLRVFVPPAA